MQHLLQSLVRAAAVASLVALPLGAAQSSKARARVPAPPTTPGAPSSYDASAPAGTCGKVLVDFEERANGADLQDATVDGLFRLRGLGPNAGAALFDSDPLGPNAASSDPDLLVGSGNVLILQSATAPGQTVPGIYDAPDDNRHGGTLEFSFFRPEQPLAIDLVDICPDGGLCIVTLFDKEGDRRFYTVPAGFTNDVSIQGVPGRLQLRLDKLAPQRGVHSTATVSEDPGFDGRAVVRLEVLLTGSGAVDNLELAQDRFDFPQPAIPLERTGSFASGDLDQDGDPDLALIDNDFANPIRLWSNRGDGVYEPLGFAQASGFFSGIELADLNGDSRVDLIVTDIFADHVLVLLALPGGGFGSAASYTTFEGCGSIAVADLSGDGVPDLALGPREQSGNVAVYLLNLGNGSFGPSTLLVPTSTSGYGPMLAGDLDDDGQTDLVLPQGHDSVGVWFNAGGGSFGALSLFDAGGVRPDGAVLVDYDDDGDLDVVVACEDSDHVSVLENDGNGTLSVQSTLPVPTAPRHVRAFDQDADGDLDFLVSGDPAGFLIHDEGAGVFGAPVPLPLGRDPVNVEAFDTNADGVPDLLESSDYLATLSTAFGTAEGDYLTRRTYPTGQNSEEGGVLADFDGDGQPDLAWATRSSSLLHVSAGAADGSFGPALSSGGCAQPTRIDTADFDGDGRLDLAALCGSLNGSVVMLRGAGDGTFVVDAEFPRPGAILVDLVTADLDGDGDADVLVIDRSSSGLGNPRILLYANDGAGGFGEQVLMELPRAQELALADIDGDGDLDLAVAQWVLSRFSVFLNTGGTTFGPGTVYLTPAGDPVDLVFGDWDGDGDADLATVLMLDPVTSALHAYVNDGAGAFSATYTGPTVPSIFGLGVGDLDLDGRDDLYFGTSNLGWLRTLRSRGDGTFDERVFTVNAATRAVHGADVDGDGRLELIAVSRLGEISVLAARCR